MLRAIFARAGPVSVIVAADDDDAFVPGLPRDRCKRIDTLFWSVATMPDTVDKLSMPQH